jgi:hypothetical protein
MNKRQTGKGWVVIFVCTATSAVHMVFAVSYSAESFLMALRRFMYLRGTPSWVQLDRGEQLVAAPSKLTYRTLMGILQLA